LPILFSNTRLDGNISEQSEVVFRAGMTMSQHHVERVMELEREIELLRRILRKEMERKIYERTVRRQRRKLSRL